MLIQDLIIYDKIIDIPDFHNFQTAFTICQLNAKYTKEISKKDVGRYHIFENNHIKVIKFRAGAVMSYDIYVIYYSSYDII